MLNFVQLTGTDLPPSEKTVKDYAKLHGLAIPTHPDGERLYVGQFTAQALAQPSTATATSAEAANASRNGLSQGLVAQRDYALKTLLGASSAENAVVLWSRALHALPLHANVVAPDAVVFDGRHRASFIAMPYVTSLNLREYRQMAFEQHRAISCDSIRRIVLDILCGLYHLHLHGLVHRNVHPGNVIIDIASGVARVTDLSFSAVIHNGAGAVKAPALMEKLLPESARWADPALIGADADAATAHCAANDVWGFANVLHGLFCSGDLSPMTPYVSGTTAAITADSLDAWVGVEESDEAVLQQFRQDLADLLRTCLQPEPSARPTVKSLFAHPFVFPAVLTALEQSREAGAAALYAHQQNATQNHLRALFTGTWLEQFSADSGSSSSAAADVWNWLSGGVSQLKEKVSELMVKPLDSATVTAPIPVAGAQGHSTPDQSPPQAQTPMTPLFIASPMGTRGFLTSARTATSIVATFTRGVSAAAPGGAAAKWHASHGLLFEVEVAAGVSLVRLQNLCFSACGDIWDLRGQLFWAPGALLTGADAEDALRAASWTPACKKPRHFHKVMARHPLAVGPFRATLHQHCEVSSSHNVDSTTARPSFGTRFTLLLITNNAFGVQYASVMATRHGTREVPAAPLNIGDELAPAGPTETKLRVFAGVACDAAVPGAIGGVLAPVDGPDGVDDGDEGDSDLDTQPLSPQDRRVSGDDTELENFNPVWNESLGAALVEARRRGEAVGFCGSLRYGAQ